MGYILAGVMGVILAVTGRQCIQLQAECDSLNCELRCQKEVNCAKEKEMLEIQSRLEKEIKQLKAQLSGERERNDAFADDMIKIMNFNGEENA